MVLSEQNIINPMLPQKTQFPSLTPPNREEINFSRNYDQLNAGINRIRYIKKKQLHNHNMITSHLNNILNKCQKNHDLSTPKIQVTLPKSHSTPLHTLHAHSKFKYNIQQSSPYQTIKEPRNFHPIQSQITTKPPRDFSNLFTEKENYERRSGIDTHEENIPLVTQSKPQTRQEKQRRLFVKKQENYQEMRELHVKREEKKKQIYQEKLNVARDRRLKALVSRQEGRKRIEEQYFTHIETIKIEKEDEKERKLKMREKKYNELVEIQKKEEEELSLFEKSIIIQEDLKEFIQQTRHRGKLQDVVITDDTTFL